MASLQTLRNKGGVIVAIIIGLALISFVLGDMLTSSNTLFGSERTAGEIQGEDISIQEYTERENYLKTINAFMTGSESLTPEQIENISMQAWETFVREYAFMPAAEKLGIKTTSEQLTELFYGQKPSPIVQQIFVNPQTGLFDPQYLSSFAASLDQDQTGNAKIFWAYIQNEVADQSTVIKYKTLVDKAAYTTDLEAKLATTLLENNFDIRFVSKSYASVPDSTITVTDSEIKKFYDTHKAIFRTADTRTMSYVMFEALPSAQDFADAQKYIAQLALDFQASEMPVQFANTNTRGQRAARYYSQDELAGPLAIYAFSGRPDSIYGPVLTGEQYTLARITDTRSLPDTIDLSHIVLRADQTKTADSLMAAIKAGSDFATEAMKFSLDDQTAPMGGKIGPMDLQTLSPEFTKELIGATTGEVKLITTPQTIHIMKVNSVTGMKPRVQLATITYDIEISDATRNATYARANAFATKAAGALENYNKAVADSAMIARTTIVTPNQRDVQGIEDSHKIISWAYNNADKEKVSKVITVGDNFIVTALTDGTAEGTAPLEKVKADITTFVKQEKKGTLLAEQFAKAPSLESLAMELDDSVKTATDINFNTFVIPQVGMEPAISGALCGMDAAKLSKPIVGIQGVYLMQIVAQTSNPTSVEIEKQRISAENQQMAFQNAYGAFIQLCDIKDTRYKFY